MNCWRGETLWAVFDGHRGQEVAGYASLTVPQLVWQNMSHPNFLPPGEAVSEALRQTHEYARVQELKAGSTAVVVVTWGDFLYCASAGDSRVVAGMRDGGVVRMSKHHDTKNPEEMRRIQASGINLGFTGRLGGFLPVTRGLGNFDLERDGFSCVADVVSLPRCQVDFVIIASDGLWDVISDEDCCRLVRDYGIAAASEHLSTVALARWGQLGSNDDIAIIVAGFPADGMNTGAAAHMGA